MAAPKGNQFWKLRSTHGRDAIFTEPEKLWEAACEYFEWCEENPIQEIDYRGKDADQVVLERLRAFTIHGLCIYLDVNTQYFRDFQENKERCTKEFSLVITRIMDIIYEQKFTGAAANQLNANIIARDLGLRDASKTEVTGPDGSEFKVTMIL